MSSDLRSRGHQVQVCSCVLVLSAVLYALALSGCGGGGGGQAASDSSAAGRGAVTVLVPGSGQQGRVDRAVFGRVIPNTTQSFLILVLRGGVQVAEKSAARTAQDQVVTIADIPVGLVDVIVRALDASGATVAEAILTNYLVAPGTNPAVSVTLTPVSPTSSPSSRYIYVLNGSGASRSNTITTIAVPPSGSPTCVAAVNVSLAAGITPSPAGMVRWGTYQSPNPQPTNYLYVANSTSPGGNVNRFSIDSGTGLLANQAEQPIAPVPPSPGAMATPSFIGPSRNTTGTSYTPPPYLYVLAQTSPGWNSHPYSVGADGALTLGAASTVFSGASSVSFLPDMSWAYLSAQGFLGSFTVATGGALGFSQSVSAVGTMSDSLVNATASFRYAYFLDSSSQRLYYYAITSGGALVLPGAFVTLPDWPSKMTLVTRSDFPAGEQYLYIACSSTIHCYRIQNGIPTALNPATGYSISVSGSTLSPWGGLDTDPNGQSLWVSATDGNNNSFASVFNIAPGPNSTASPGILTPWLNMPIPVTDGAGTQMKGASTIIVKD